MPMTPGLTKRILAMRLSELEREGFIVRAEVRRNHAKWAVTEKGEDVLPVPMALVRFGSQWHAGEVFADGKPRSLDENFDASSIRRILGSSSRATRRSPFRTGSPSERYVPAPPSVDVTT